LPYFFPVDKKSKNGLGYNLGDFFTNSSGHPDKKTTNTLPPFSEHNLGDGKSSLKPLGRKLMLPYLFIEALDRVTQLSLWSDGPKCSPTHFFVKMNASPLP
jgi:hypothetical protein